MKVYTLSEDGELHFIVFRSLEAAMKEVDGIDGADRASFVEYPADRAPRYWGSPMHGYIISELELEPDVYAPKP